MADLATRLPAVMDTNTVRAAFAFIIVGLSVKLALFPLHIWLPMHMDMRRLWSRYFWPQHQRKSLCMRF